MLVRYAHGCRVPIRRLWPFAGLTILNCKTMTHYLIHFNDNTTVTSIWFLCFKSIPYCSYLHQDPPIKAPPTQFSILLHQPNGRLQSEANRLSGIQYCTKVHFTIMRMSQYLNCQLTLFSEWLRFSAAEHFDVIVSSFLHRNKTH